MKSKEDRFTHELEVFRGEVDSAIQFLYAYLTTNDALADNKKALGIVNRTPLFWRTNLGALHTAFFITLGRIFDQNSNHNVDRLLRVAQEEIILFSAQALEARKRKDNPNAGQWIADYMKTAYVPTADDFRRLRKHVSRYRKIYEHGCHNIRRKVHAHKELSKPEDVQALYNQTNIWEMEKLLIFLNKVHLTLWELFHNGRKPVLRPMRYSVKSMRKAETPQWKSRHVQEQIINETERFFKMLSSSQ